MATVDSLVASVGASTESPTAPEAAFPSAVEHDEIALRLWKVARRADALVRETQRGPGLNCVCWLVAEAELCGDMPQAIALHEHAGGNKFCDHLRRNAT